ncbi:polysaccharide pyruvyl transferase family protein [Nocardioides lacusdianchii]|uniref:polysaccharide pyruvyl transferase family protein n=1 Tax=Nocardioides lacusdianchii TaxID=2783664 RepID=UPI001CCE38D2|nr:polysaccharide pyruvyl transferase family protein [Nocardioides lacusdianchii]
MRSGERSGHVLIATVGLGNIGDQAMLEAFLDNSSGPVTVIVARPGALTIPSRHSGRATLEHLPNLVDGFPLRRRASRQRFLALVGRAATCSVVGADIMDGGYAPREAVLRCSALEMAHAAGATTAVMGFSWNGRPHPAAGSALARIAPTTHLYSRDPFSAARLREQGIACTQVSDMVFAFNQSSAPADLSAWAEAQSGRRLVIVNASGLLASVDRTSQYQELVRELRRSDVAVLLLPHVLRAGDDDLAACTQIYEDFRDDEAVALVSRQLAPAEVSWLAARADAVFTARMHLSILALNHGTPVCVVATQGKVEGMLSMFDLEQYALHAGPGLAVEAASALTALMSDDLRPGLRQSHQDVAKLARLQFDHVRAS